MAVVAIFTFGRLKHPYDHHDSYDFYRFGHKVMRQAYFSEDLIKEFSTDDVAIPDELNPEGYPVVTLTVWKNIQPLVRFTYSGRHLQALKNRGNWMERYSEKHRPYIVWWTEHVKEVSWEEAFKRYQYYSEHGSSPYAFDFKRAYDEDGERVTIQFDRKNI